MKEVAMLLTRLDTGVVQKSFYHCLTHALEALSVQDIWLVVGKSS